MTITRDAIEEFFDRYEAALLSRNETAIAAMYAVPSLILFPGQSIAVSDPKQTEQFFGSSWDQYEGVAAMDRDLTVMKDAAATVWVDLTWSHTNGGERFCYQLVQQPEGLQIAVLTPLGAPWDGGAS